MTEPVPRRSSGDLVPRLVASLVLAVGFAWMLRRGGIPLAPGAAAFAEASWWLFPVAVLTNSVAAYFRTCRWIHLLRPIAPGLSPARVLGVGYVGFTAVVMAPLRSGEVVRPYLLARDGDVTFAQALGATAVERIVDGLAITMGLMIAMAVARPLSPLPDHLGTLHIDIGLVRHGAHAALALFVTAFATIIAFYAFRDRVVALVDATIGRVSPRLAALGVSTLSRLADGLRALPSAKHLVPFLRDSVLYYLAMSGGNLLILRAAGVPATFAEAWVVLGVLSIAILVPAGPGFFGAFQLSSYCALAMYFPERVTLGPGAAFVFANYTTHLAVTLAFCGVGFSLMARNPASKPVR
ncbi:MAG TPA: lysylphosphatidylglycerol synthase transmembrane domain-containing protein [Polyangiaceae bacterium]|nr:lysylphosphatidylglycerol synthase transmembrane domain-containing protein [Polyangiaceae bacterium]